MSKEIWCTNCADCEATKMIFDGKIDGEDRWTCPNCGYEVWESDLEFYYGFSPEDAVAEYENYNTERILNRDPFGDADEDEAEDYWPDD